MNPSEYFPHKRVLITGGLGFLGSNVARRLVELGSDVTLVDNLNPLYGGNRFNISGIEKKLAVSIGDIRDDSLMKPLVEKADVIFHFAAQVSYIDSPAMPLEDLSLNAQATLQLLELCRKHNPKARILFSSSRMVVGKVDGGIMKEESPTNPPHLYGIHKLASEKYLLMYHHDFGIPSTIFRITNPYGPRQQVKHSKYSLVGWFVRQAMEGKTITVFGDGQQVRDYIYADDIVEAFLRAAAADETAGEIINIGSGVPTKFRDMVSTVVSVVGKGNVEHEPWPKDYEKIETGYAVADISKLRRLTGFEPRVGLRDGVQKTHEYYSRNIERYRQ